MKILLRNANGMLTLLLGVVVFIFYAFFYANHLHFQEQLQLFQFTVPYFIESISIPSGFTAFLSQFITQFFYLPWVGPVLMALLMVRLQLMVKWVAFRIKRNPNLEPFTFVPPLFLWALLCDENYMLGGLVALILTLQLVWVLTKISSPVVRIVATMIFIPITYWLAGGTAILMPLIMIVFELTRPTENRVSVWWIGAGYLILMLISPLIAKNYLVLLPSMQVFIGYGYYRYLIYLPFGILLLWALTFLVMLLYAFLPKSVMDGKKSLPFYISSLFLVWGGAAYLVAGSYNRIAEEVMTYDYLVRTQQWDKAVAMAEKDAPANPLAVASLNLALSQKGLLGDKMFHFIQNGSEGLIPQFDRDYLLPMMVGEVYYYLGLTNTAQRFAFEGMEAIPDYQKSARCLKRLAETNLINGSYEVSRKYLLILQNTFFYKDWATETLAYLGDEDRINNHSEWGRIRKYRPKEDFLFDGNQLDMILGMLIQQEPTNRMAYEYLMGYCLLNKDLPHFMQYVDLGKEIGYKSMPISYQEAALYVWGLQSTDLSQTPFPVNNEVKKRMQTYAGIYTTREDAQMYLEKEFADTYWYYFHYRYKNIIKRNEEFRQMH